MRKALLLLAIWLGPSTYKVLYCQVPAVEPTFSIAQLREDFNHYRNEIEMIHPGLYLYSTKNEVDSRFDSLTQLIDRPMTAMEFQRLLSLSSEWVKDGHTVILPSEGTRAYHDTHSRFVPYQFVIHKDGLYVKLVCTDDRSVPEGAKVISLNGVPTDEVVRQMAQRLPRDGQNLSYPNWIIGSYFREFYSYTFGYPDSIEVVWQKADEAQVTSTIRALPKDSIRHFRALRYPEVLATESAAKGIIFEMVNTYARIARLSIRDFHNDGLRNVYGQRFKREIASAFKQIKRDSVEHLILDLRDNQGGEVGNGIFLLAHLLDVRFKVILEYRKREGLSVTRCGGPHLGYHKPVSSPFRGKLYVLLNGGSFSNSVIVASCLRENQRASFFGTESGGNPCILNGDAKSLTLPNTKTMVDIPTRQYVLTMPWSNQGVGLIPENHMSEDPRHITEQKDTLLEKILKQILKQREFEQKMRNSRRL